MRNHGLALLASSWVAGYMSCRWDMSHVVGFHSWGNWSVGVDAGRFVGGRRWCRFLVGALTHKF